MVNKSQLARPTVDDGVFLVEFGTKVMIQAYPEIG